MVLPHFADVSATTISTVADADTVFIVVVSWAQIEEMIVVVVPRFDSYDVRSRQDNGRRCTTIAASSNAAIAIGTAVVDEI
jgi:hypothetical protein